MPTVVRLGGRSGKNSRNTAFMAANSPIMSVMHRHLQHAIGLAAGSGQQVQYVLQRLARLGLDAGLEFAGAGQKAHLTRDEHQVAPDHGGRVRQAGIAADELFSMAASRNARQPAEPITATTSISTFRPGRARWATPTVERAGG